MPSGRNENDYMLPQAGKILVDEPFKGTVASALVPFSQAGHNCAPKFKEGEEYIFYMAKHAGEEVWEAPGCHRTRSVADGADDLLFLRALPRSAGRTRVSGEIQMSEDSIEQGFRTTGGIAGFTVRLRGDNGAEQTLQTSSEGVYEVYDLLPGKYEATVEIPKGQKLRFPMVAGAQRDPVQEGTQGVAFRLSKGQAIEASFVLQEDNRLTGRALDGNGKPLQDVCLDLEPEAGKAGRGFYVADCTAENGSFELKDMPAGRYRIVANRDGVLSSREPFPATYYPGVLDKALAGVLTVRAGEAQENLEFRIRATAKVVSVSGRFEFKDGRPVSYEGLRFTPLTGGQEEHFPVAEDGSFRISLLAGRPGNLVGELFVQRDAIKACPQFGTGTIKGRISGPATPPALIATEQDQSNVILTLEMESCAGWKPRH